MITDLFTFILFITVLCRNCRD